MAKSPTQLIDFLALKSSLKFSEVTRNQCDFNEMISKFRTLFFEVSDPVVFLRPYILQPPFTSVHVMQRSGFMDLQFISTIDYRGHIPSKEV